MSKNTLSYDKNGYIVLKHFFPQEKLNLVQTQLQSIIGHELAKAGIQATDIPNEGLLELEQKDHNIIQRIYDTFSGSDGLLNIVSDTKLRNVIKDLLG